MRKVGRPSRMWIAGAIYALMLLVGIAIPTAYIVQSPGPVLDVTGEIDGEEILEISGLPTSESETDFLMTTVTATGNADHGVPGVVAASAVFSRNLQLVPVRALYPREVTSAEIRERNLSLMDFSQDTAAAVAFETAGLDVAMTLSIARVPDESPAAGKLQEGDVLKAISSAADGTNGVEFVPIETFKDLSGVLDATPEGTEVSLKIEREGQEKTVSVVTEGFEPDVTGWVHPGSKLGVFVQVTDVELPAEVEYVVDNIGGPSAGMIFALTIYDAVTEGSLGGDSTIAGTGAIAWDGEIDSIGGIRHKINAAADAGATDFIAPAPNCPETAGFEPDGLNIWAVRTIDEAIDVVESIETGDTSGLTPCSAIELVEPLGTN
ncbi:PDZ domain-containing protein [Trueperella bonasi]|uniref:PDZ domain-containing protein n=1 Tax=Trueperella bonasi TaxID=312286 RepID=A0ABT9NHB5_9ACTO|nr:S16 family serine protease [Trueperella bonasi]MDP9806794.1 PDZ domain-containing protein [Trueperella bonasi]